MFSRQQLLACTPNLTRHIQTSHAGFSAQSASLVDTNGDGGEDEENDDRDYTNNSEQADGDHEYELKNEHGTSLRLKY